MFSPITSRPSREWINGSRLYQGAAEDMGEVILFLRRQ